MDWEGHLAGCIVNDAQYKDCDPFVESKAEFIQYHHEIGRDVGLPLSLLHAIKT